MGSHLSLASARHLPWHARLHAMAARCYADALSEGAAAAGPGGDAAVGSSVTFEQASAFLEDGIARADHLAALQALDPVPPDPAEAAARAAARAELLALRPLLGAAGGAAQAMDGAGPAAAAAAASRPEPALRDALQGLRCDQARLRVLASLLASACGGAVLRREPGGVPPKQQPAVEEAEALLAPELEALEALSAAAALWATQQQQQQQQQPQQQQQQQGEEGEEAAAQDAVLERAQAATKRLTPRVHLVSWTGPRATGRS
jgi:hypothetical protein